MNVIFNEREASWIRLLKKISRRKSFQQESIMYWITGRKEPSNKGQRKSFHVQDTSVWQDGCLVHTCKGGIKQESLSEECVGLVKKTVEEIVEKKLTEKGNPC